MNKVDHKRKAEEWLDYVKDGNQFEDWNEKVAISVGPKTFQVDHALKIAEIHAILSRSDNDPVEVEGFRH